MSSRALPRLRQFITAGYTPSASTSEAAWWPLPALAGYALLVATYFSFRFGTLWAENDTAVQALVIRSTAEQASLTPVGAAQYPGGYVYAAVSALILAFTGLSVSTLQRVVFPLVSTLIVFPAWALYRELCVRRSTAAVAVLLLFLQAEFLFVVLRGSHERVTRTLMFLMIWLLVRSFRFSHRPAVFVAHLLLFYAAAYALFATNTLFAASFLAATGMATAGAWLLGSRWRMAGASGDPSGMTLRLASAVFGIALVGFVFVFYVYAPAEHELVTFRSLSQKTASLVLTTSAGEDPYSQVASGWVSLVAYFAVSIGDYLLIAASIPVWLAIGFGLLRGKSRPALPTIMLWLLFGAFAAQGAAAILADRTGMLGSNLQHRSFPSFAMLATPLVAMGLTTLRARAMQLCAGVVIAAVTVLSVLKATNEPTLSNKWTFYTTAELRALEWADRHHRGTSVWVGPDERLAAAYWIEVGLPGSGNHWDTHSPSPLVRSYVMSDVIRAYSVRLGVPLPASADAHIVYDNGAAEVHHRRPRTPFQR